MSHQTVPDDRAPQVHSKRTITKQAFALNMSGKLRPGVKLTGTPRVVSVTPSSGLAILTLAVNTAAMSVNGKRPGVGKVITGFADKDSTPGTYIVLLACDSDAGELDLTGEIVIEVKA